MRYFDKTRILTTFIWFDLIRFAIACYWRLRLQFGIFLEIDVCFFVFLFAGNALKNFFIRYWLNDLAAWNRLQTYINLNACVCEMKEQRRQRWKRAWKDQLNKFSSQIELEIRAKNKTRSKSARRAKSKTEQKKRPMSEDMNILRR